MALLRFLRPLFQIARRIAQHQGRKALMRFSHSPMMPIAGIRPAVSLQRSRRYSRRYHDRFRLQVNAKTRLDRGLDFGGKGQEFGAAAAVVHQRQGVLRR